ncbi:MAG: CHAT domain-containing protein, partial [Propionibacteriaceae bacterium]
QVAAAMDGAELVHVAAHGRLRSDNPQFSALVLADGPYTVYDLERLRSAPRHVILAACDTGRTVSVAGQEILGLTAALLSQGTATLVAPVVPVPDAETVDLMLAYHRNLRQGRPPAEALALAQQDSNLTDSVANVAAAGFVCLGDGTQRARQQPKPTPPVRTRPDSAQARKDPAPQSAGLMVTSARG